MRTLLFSLIFLQTADASEHWAFQPVRRPEAAPVSLSWGEGAIDNFVLARLEREGLAPSGEASRETLVRRLFFGVVGLPPTTLEVDAFVNNSSPAAYDQLVDRLLASPHFGERWGRHWLDGAHYADSQGYEFDTFRSIWRYRDWVVDALNKDLPYDQFVVEQLAGDLLPEATLEQRIATGFNRNSLGGSDNPGFSENLRLQGVIERTNTVGAVFLGLTLGCAQCHDHKLEPISQREYYQLFAFFNNSGDPTVAVGVPVPESYIAQGEKGDKENDDGKDKDKDKPKRDYTTSPVLNELPQRRKTTIFVRGVFETPGEEVQPDVPRVLPPLRKTVLKSTVLKSTVLKSTVLKSTVLKSTVLKSTVLKSTVLKSPSGLTDASGAEDRPPNRLDLARWIVSGEHPLTARVVVNRIWQGYFGLGLVETENDFGTNGARPSHPELLDWLAAELIDSGWSLKHVHRLIVTSATYRQSSIHRSELAASDPRNRFLARASRVQLEAEAIRDAVLSTSGLLSLKMGGPSVFPYQIETAMEGRADQSRWTASEGDDLHRRGLYVHFWRLTPHPFLRLFNVPDAVESCTRRQRSNTPLQALALLNHPWVTECSRSLAARALSEGSMQEGPVGDAERLDWAFRVCLGRGPDGEERQILAKLLEEERSARTADVDPDATADVLAWTAVARAIYNLDEFITRE